MPRSDPANELAARVVKTSEMIHAANESILRKLQEEDVLLHIKILKTDIEILERNIKTTEYMASCSGSKPETGSLREQLIKLREELKAAEADHELNYPQSAH